MHVHFIGQPIAEPLIRAAPPLRMIFPHLTLLFCCALFYFIFPSLKFELIKIFQLKYFAGNCAPNVHTYMCTRMHVYVCVSTCMCECAYS